MIYNLQLPSFLSYNIVLINHKGWGFMRLIYGKGYNSGGFYKARIGGKKTKLYRKWENMLTRCYSENFQQHRPTYIGCTVAEEWHDFQRFAEWHESQKYSNAGYALDKDLLIHGNKIYSATTCCLIPVDLNNLLLSRGGDRGVYPQGVSFDKMAGKYIAQMSINGVVRSLGRFNCVNDAHQTYKTTKERYVKNKALEWANRIEWNVFVALMSWRLCD